MIAYAEDLYIAQLHEVALAENAARSAAEFGFGYMLGAAAMGDPKFIRALRICAKFARKLPHTAPAKSNRRLAWERSEHLYAVGQERDQRTDRLR